MTSCNGRMKQLHNEELYNLRYRPNFLGGELEIRIEGK
jgi:hypothetical protein